MVEWLPPLAVALAALLLLRALRRHGELCVLDVRGGRCVVVRGKLPVRLRQDFDDVLRRGRVAQGRLRVLRQAERARLEVDRRLDASTAQQLRNVLGTWPLARLR